MELDDNGFGEWGNDVTYEASPHLTIVTGGDGNGVDATKGAGEIDDDLVKRFKHKVSVSLGVNDPTNTVKVKQKFLSLFARIKGLKTIDQRNLKVFSADGSEIETTALPDGDKLIRLFNLHPRVNRRFKTNVEGFLVFETSAKTIWTIKKGIMEFLKNETISINEIHGASLEPMVVLGFLHNGDSRMNPKWITKEINQQIMQWLDNAKRTKFKLANNFASDLVFYFDRISIVHDSNRITKEKGITVMCPQQHKDMYLEFLQRDQLLSVTSFGPLARSIKFVSFSWKAFSEAKIGIAKAIRSTDINERSRKMVTILGLDFDDTLKHREMILHACKEIVYLEPTRLVERNGSWNVFFHDSKEEEVIKFVDERLKPLLEHTLGRALKNVGHTAFKRLDVKHFDTLMYHKVFAEVSHVPLPAWNSTVAIGPRAANTTNAWTKRLHILPQPKDASASVSALDPNFGSPTQERIKSLSDEFEREMQKHREMEKLMTSKFTAQMDKFQDDHIKVRQEMLEAAKSRAILAERLDSAIDALNNRINLISDNMGAIADQGMKQGKIIEGVVQQLTDVKANIVTLEESISVKFDQMMRAIQSQGSPSAQFKRDSQERQKGLTPEKSKRQRPERGTDLSLQFDAVASDEEMGSQAELEFTEEAPMTQETETGRPRAAGQSP